MMRKFRGFFIFHRPSKNDSDSIQTARRGSLPLSYCILERCARAFTSAQLSRKIVVALKNSEKRRCPRTARAAGNREGGCHGYRRQDGSWHGQAQGQSQRGR